MLNIYSYLFSGHVRRGALGIFLILDLWFLYVYGQKNFVRKILKMLTNIKTIFFIEKKKK